MSKTAKECCPDKVEAVMNLSGFTPDDLERVQGLTEAHIDDILANAEVAKAATERIVELEAELATLKAEQKDVDEAVTNQKPKTKEDWLDSAPDDIKAVLNHGLKLAEAQKAEGIKTIMANKSNPYTEDDLAGMTNDQITKIAALASTPSKNYVGNQGGAPVEPETDEDDFEVPVVNYAKP